MTKVLQDKALHGNSRGPLPGVEIPVTSAGTSTYAISTSERSVSRGRLPRWLALAPLAVLMGDLFKGFSDWVTSQPEWAQGVIVTIVGAALLGFIPACGFVLGRVVPWWQRRRALAGEQADLLTPKPHVGLIQAPALEAKATAEMGEAFQKMIAANERFQTRAQENMDRMKSGKVTPDRAVDEATATMKKFAGEMDSGVRVVRREIGVLVNCWSSRMYWHDKRSSASDIFDGVESIRDLSSKARETASTFLAHDDSLDGLRGYHAKLDAEIARYMLAVSGLDQAAKSLDLANQTVVRFVRQRSGVRGVLRRQWRRLRS